MDWEHSEIECPQCGHETRTKDCDAIHCDDGYIDRYEDDAINYRPGMAFVMCRECIGTGHHHWCAKCGWDLILNWYMNGKPKEPEINVAESKGPQFP